jgi:glycosyltransferase involved in cell wall biosynthesis
MTEAQIAALPAGVMGWHATASTAELAQWYTAADCLINPTLEDNMPMVNLEALACGTPVVAFATGGCPEAIDESCGAIVPKGDVQAMADAVRTIAPRKAELMDACLRRSALFDSAACAADYYRLYQEMAE